MINYAIGYFIFALFISLLDRYLSGEDFKKSEWINKKTLKFKLIISTFIVILPFLFKGFFSENIIYIPTNIIGMLLGFLVGEKLLALYDWGFKTPAPTMNQENTNLNEQSQASNETLPNEQTQNDNVSNVSSPNLAQSIQVASENIKEGLKTMGEKILQASEKMLKDDEKKPNKPYEPNKKLDEKIGNY